MQLVLFFIIGAIYGSFLNMLLWRLPRSQGIGGRSQCQYCHRTINWHDLVPIFSYLILKGRCRNCGVSIPINYLLVELASAASLGIFGFFAAPSPLFGILFGTYIICTFVGLFFFDLFYFILPDVFILPAIAITLAYQLLIRDAVSLFISALIFGLFFGILYLVSHGKWLGLGDVKLVVLIGLLFDYPIALAVILVSIWIGAGIGLALIATGKATLKKALPFGAILSAVSVVAFIFHNAFTFFEIFFR